MDGVALLADARAAGLTVAADGDRLIVTGPKRLGDLARQVLAHKGEVLALLAAETGLQSPQDAPGGQEPAGAQPQPASAGRGQPTDDGAIPSTLAQPLPYSEQPEWGHSLLKTETMDGKAVHAPLELWVYDRLHPAPGIAPWPAPPDLNEAQVATAVDAARVLCAPASATAGAAARGDKERQPRRHGKPPEVRHGQPTAAGELVARILAAGEQLGWPALALRPGERLAAGEESWQKLAAHGPASRLHDAARALPS